MERIVTPEERYKRAEEIYRRRNGQKTSNSNSHLENKPDFKGKKLKRTVNQLMVSILIYLSIVAIKSADIDLTKDILKKTSYFISHDVNFMEIYNQAVDYINNNYTSKLFKDVNSEATSQVQVNVNQIDEEELPEASEGTNMEQKEDASSITEQVINTEVNDNLNTEEAVGGTTITEGNNNVDQMQIDAQEIKSKYSFQKPVEGVVSSKFGERQSDNSIVSKYHNGIDIAVTEGTPIKASIAGKVTTISSQGDFGKHIKITTNDVIAIYAHCSSINVKEGQTVSQGDVIALSGNTGTSTGPHLHFEVQKSGRVVNPEYIMQF